MGKIVLAISLALAFFFLGMMVGSAIISLKAERGLRTVRIVSSKIHAIAWSALFFLLAVIMVLVHITK